MTVGVAWEAAGDVPAPIRAAQELLPKVRAAADDIERERRLPRDLVDALLDAGLFHLLAPAEAAGSGCDPITAAQVVEEVATVDGSTAWCLMIAAQNAALLGFLGRDALAAMQFGPRDIACGVARPIGRAVRTSTPEPGYTVSGRWPFASGSSHATWFGAECVVYDGDASVRDANGNEVTRFTWLRRKDVTVIDTWDTTGLRGTASHDFSAEGAFCPADRGHQMLVTRGELDFPLLHAEPLVFINQGSVCLGLARGVIETAIGIARTKPGWGTDQPLGQTPRFQGAVGEAIATVEAARAYLYGVSRALWEAALSGEAGDPRLRSRVHLAKSIAAQASRRAADLVADETGSAAFIARAGLERKVRDVRTGAAHIMVSPLTIQAAARVEMGHEAGFPFF